MKKMIWDPCLFFLLGNEIFLTSTRGPEYQTQGFTMDILIFKPSPQVHDLVIHLLNCWSPISKKTTTKGSKSGFSTNSAQIEHFQ